MSHRDNYARCRSSTSSIDKIALKGLVALGILRQNAVQKVDPMRTELTNRQSVLKTPLKSETHRPDPNH